MNKTILITGCSSGIGLYCAKQLKKDGWSVFATARKAADIENLKKLGLHALYLDYTDTQSIHKAFHQMLGKSGGRLDALFNNGAYGQAGAVEDLSTNVLRAQFETNFFGYHELTNLAVPVMRKQGSGRIIHCSSVLGYIHYSWRGAYNSSKFALEGLASTMRLELRGSGIHVCLIEPGPIDTKFTANGLPHFINNIDRQNSVHRLAYEKQLERLKTGGGANRFRLGPDAVYRKLHHALHAKRPRAHYYVTIPAQLLAVAKRVLPHSWLDYLLARTV